MQKCSDCRNPVAPGKSRCQSCLTKRAAYAKTRSNKFKEEGLCCDCGSPCAEGSVYCASHRDTHQAASRRRYAQYLEQGLCSHCGGPGPEDGGSLCPHCRSMFRKNARRHEAKSPKSLAKKRDHSRCQLCGKETSLVVHHRDGQGERESELTGNHTLRQTPNNALDNLVTLCRHCHGVLHHVAHNVDATLFQELVTDLSDSLKLTSAK